MNDESDSDSANTSKPGPWLKWDGNYEKKAYDVWVKGCDVVLACWPNSGYMVAVDGSGRMWRPDEVLAIRLSEFQGCYPKPDFLK